MDRAVRNSVTMLLSVAWTLWAVALSVYENAWLELYAFEETIYEVIFSIIVSSETSVGAACPPVVGVFEVVPYSAPMCMLKDRGAFALVCMYIAESVYTLAVTFHRRPILSTLVTFALSTAIYLAVVAATWIMQAPTVVKVAYATVSNRTLSGSPSWESAVEKLHVKLRGSASGAVYELVYNDNGDVVGYLPERPAFAEPKVAGRFEAATLHGTVKPVSTAAAKKLRFIVPLFSCEGPDGVEDVTMVGTGFRVGDCIFTARHVAEIATHAAKVSGSELDLTNLSLVELPKHHSYTDGHGSGDLDIAYYRCEPRVFSVLALKGVEIQKDRSPLMRESMVAVAGFRAEDVATCRGVGRVIARINDAGMQFTYNAPTTPGMSGAPIIVGKKVVGVHLGSCGGSAAENVNYGCYAVPFLRLAVNPKYTPTRLAPRHQARTESPWTSQDRNLFRLGLDEGDAWAIRFMSNEDVVDTFGIRFNNGFWDYLSDEEDPEFYDPEERLRALQEEDLAIEADYYDRVDDAAFGYESGKAVASAVKQRPVLSEKELAEICEYDPEALEAFMSQYLPADHPVRVIARNTRAVASGKQETGAPVAPVEPAASAAEQPASQDFGAGHQKASEDSLTSRSTATGALKGKRNGKGKQSPPTKKKANKGKSKRSLKASSKSGASKASSTAPKGK